MKPSTYSSRSLGVQTPQRLPRGEADSSALVNRVASSLDVTRRQCLVGLGGALLGWDAHAAQWTQTEARDMADVAVAQDGSLWLVGRNGTVWTANPQGGGFRRIQASDFARIAVAPNGAVWAVGRNGSLWQYTRQRWQQTQASDMGDVTVTPDGKVWLAGRNGTIWVTTNQGRDFQQIEANGFKRVSAAPDNSLWAVGSNGTVWRYAQRWHRSRASDMQDVGVGADGKVWLVGRPGTVWVTQDGDMLRPIEDASGFESIAAGRDGAWGVGGNGTLWHCTNTI